MPNPWLCIFVIVYMGKVSYNTKVHHLINKYMLADISLYKSLINNKWVDHNFNLVSLVVHAVGCLFFRPDHKDAWGRDLRKGRTMPRPSEVSIAHRFS